jgi:hypothetical protein
VHLGGSPNRWNLYYQQCIKNPAAQGAQLIHRGGSEALIASYIKKNATKLPSCVTRCLAWTQASGRVLHKSYIVVQHEPKLCFSLNKLPCQLCSMDFILTTQPRTKPWLSQHRLELVLGFGHLAVQRILSVQHQLNNHIQGQY